MSHLACSRARFPVLAAASALLAGLTGAGWTGSASASVAPLGSGSASAAPLGGGSASVAPLGGGAVMAPATRLVELPTGDQVRVTRDAAGTSASVTAANTGPGAAFLTVQLAGDEYVIPDYAQSRAGSIDPSLFDVTHPVLASGSARVTVSFAGGVRPHAIPGIRTTSVSGRTLDGVITSSSARAFGAALAGHSDSPATASPALAGVARIAPASAAPAAAPRAAAPRAAGPASAAPAGARPQYDMQTLTINVTLPTVMTSGAPPSVVIANVDGPNRYSKFVSGVTGSFSLSVPKGHYAAFADVFGVANGTTAAEWIAGNPQFTVNHDAAVTLDLSQATAPVTATTPHPSAAIGGGVSVKRAGIGGSGFGVGVINATGQPFPSYIAPTAKAPTVGTLSYDFGMRQASPPGAAAPYYYDLDFAGQGRIPADHSYHVTRWGLATIHERFGSVGAAYECPLPAHPWGEPLGGACPGLITPASISDYVTADPQTYWNTQVVGYGIEITPTVVVGGRDGQFPDSGFRTFVPGEQLDESWFSQPEAPNLLGTAGVATLDASGVLHFGTTICPACASGPALSLLLNPRGTSGAWGVLDAADSASYQVSADGVAVQGGDLTASQGQLVTTVNMPAAAHTYRIDLATSRNPSANPLSTSTQTSWQIPASSQEALPAGWVCTRSGGTGCAVVPLLTAVTALPTSDTGTLPAGQVTGSVDVSQLGGGAVTVRSVSIKLSYDGGTTWQAASTAPEGNGRYRVRFTIPATPGSTGDLLVTVNGASGATFTQTIDNAFAVAAS